MKKLNEKSTDLVTETRQIFGGADTSEERYSLSWNGKSEARQLAQEASTGTLRPEKKESRNWDSTENIYIEGDNLEALKLLQKSHYGKIDAIYIDPPYNTGNDIMNNLHFNRSSRTVFSWPSLQRNFWRRK